MLKIDGERVAHLMSYRSIPNKAELSTLTNMDHSHICKVLKGTRAVSNLTLDRMCNALKCQPGEILIHYLDQTH